MFDVRACFKRRSGRAPSSSKMAVAAATLLISGAATPFATATPLTFQWTMVVNSGTLNGQTFSGDVIFTGTSDTANAKANPITTNGSNYGYASVGTVSFSIPSIAAIGTTTDTAYVLYHANSNYQFSLSPDGVHGDAGGLLFPATPPASDAFQEAETVTGSQLVEAIGTLPVTGVVIGGSSAPAATSLRVDLNPNANATFVQAVPEPTDLAAGAMVAAGALFRRRRRG